MGMAERAKKVLDTSHKLMAFVIRCPLVGRREVGGFVRKWRIADTTTNLP
jgi:hypothetical protein